MLGAMFTYTQVHLIVCLLVLLNRGPGSAVESPFSNTTVLSHKLSYGTHVAVVCNFIHTCQGVCIVGTFWLFTFQRLVLLQLHLAKLLANLQAKSQSKAQKHAGCAVCQPSLQKPTELHGTYTCFLDAVRDTLVVLSGTLVVLSGDSANPLCTSGLVCMAIVPVFWTL